MNLFWARALTQDVFDTLSPETQKRYLKYKPGIIGAYLFANRLNAGFCKGNLRRSNDAYLRILYLKRKNPVQRLALNTIAVYNSILSIIEGKHN